MTYNKGETIHLKVFCQNNQQRCISFKIGVIISVSQYYLYNVIDLNSNIEITLKVVNKLKLDNKNALLKQIDNQKAMNGRQNFIEIFEVYEDSCNVYICMEKLGKSLTEIIQVRKCLLDGEVLCIFWQLVHILDQLRTQNIIHCEITLDSLFFNKDNVIKLGNFSKSSKVTDQNHSIKFNEKNCQKSLNRHSGRDLHSKLNDYTSPEQFINETFMKNKNYSKDIWNIGIILFKLLTGKMPFQDDSKIQNSSKIQQCSFQFPLYGNNQLIQSEWAQLIKNILTLLPNRITLRRLINHSLIRNYSYSFSGNISNCLCPRIQNCTINNAKKYERKSQIQKDNYKKSWEINLQSESNDQEKQFQNLSVDKRIKSIRKNNENCDIIQPSKKQNLKYQKLMRIDFLKSIKSLLIECQKLEIPNILTMPRYLEKFKFRKDLKCLGYILNKAIGVSFKDGTALLGHTSTDYLYFDSYGMVCSQILCSYKQKAYKYYLKYYGKRIVMEQLQVWVRWFYKQNNIYTILLSTGVWQVIFQHQGKFRFCLIDQYDNSWWKGDYFKVQIISKVRQIVRRQKSFIQHIQ